MKIVLGITGASGSIYAKTIMEQLLENKSVKKLAVVLSSNAETVWEHELGDAWLQHSKLDYFHKSDFMAPFASGSSKWDAMVILPASMGSIGRIANGISDDLMTRAADVMLKEGRKLIICPRETPFNAIHLKNMMILQDAGATILATSPSFYSKPKTFDELVKTVTNRVLDQLGVNSEAFRWGESC